MGLLVLITIGGILGWLAAILLQIEDDQLVLQNAAIGIAGAVLAGLLASHEPVAGALSVPTLLWSLIGATAGLLLLQFFRMKAVRQ